MLLEADGCGHGPSGRNGGFCQHDVVFACEHAKALGGWAGGGCGPGCRGCGRSRSGSSVSERGSTPGFIPAAISRSRPRRPTTGVWEEAWRPAESSARPTRCGPLSPDEVAARCASPAFRGGVFYPGAATVQPARLALGLRERLRASGVEVCECSPVRRLRDGPAGVEAHTDGGVVRAGAAVLAVGGGARRRRWAAAQPAHGRLLPHRPHRAGAGAAGGGRLDRRRVHHRQSRPDRLLPHHAGRPDRLRLGRRPDRDGRPPGRPDRAGPRGRLAHRRPSPRLLPRPRRAPPDPRLGRPDRRLPDSPAAGHCRCVAAAPSSPPATPATASAPPAWWARRWPHSPWTAATHPHAWPS